jgi:hypothetical protein
MIEIHLVEREEIKEICRSIPLIWLRGASASIFSSSTSSGSSNISSITVSYSMRTGARNNALKLLQKNDFDYDLVEEDLLLT